MASRRRSAGSGSAPPPTLTDLPPIVVTKPPPDSVPSAPPARPINHRTDTVSDQKIILPVIYGKVRTGGIVRYLRVIAGSRWVVLYRICWGPINSIKNIKIDGIPVADASGALAASALGLSPGDVEVYTGTKTQGLSPIMAGIDSNFIGGAPGVAYIVVYGREPTADIPAPNLYNMQCDVEGMLTFDPSQDPTLATRYYRPLPSLALADYMCSMRYGGRKATSKVYGTAELLDSISWNGTDLGSGRLRHTIGLKIDDSRPYEDWVDVLCGTGQLLRPQYNGGVYHIIADKPQTVSSYAFTDSGPDANIFDCEPQNVKDDTEIVTKARVSWVDTAKEYRDDWAEFESPFVSTGEVDLVSRDYDYQVPTYDQAQRIAQFKQRRSSIDKYGRIRVGPEGERLLPGIVIPVSITKFPGYNYASVPCRVLNISPEGLGWWVDIEPYVDVWSDLPATTTTFTPPASQSPYDTPPNIDNTLVAWSLPAGILTFTPPAYSFLKTVEVHLSIDGGAFRYWFDTATSPYVTPAITVPGAYVLKFYTRSTAGPKSSGVNFSKTVTTADIAAPKNMTIVSDRQIISYDTTGALNPASQTTTFTANKQNTTAVVNWTAKKVDGTAITPVTNLLSAATGDSVTMTAANFDTQRGSTEGVIVTATLTEAGVTLTGNVSVVKVQTGASVMTLVPHGSGGFVFSPNAIGKTGGAAGSWDGGIKSTQSYTRGAFVYFRANQTTAYFEIGLDSDPGTYPGPDTEYAFLVYGTGAVEIWENGALVLAIGTYTTATTFAITYDSFNVRYYKDGALQRAVPRAVSVPLYLDATFLSQRTTAQVVDVAFGPMGEQGTPAGQVLATPLSMAGVGGRILVGAKATTKLAADLTSGATTISVDAAVLANGDTIVLQAAPTGTQKTEHMQISSAVSGSGPYTYSVTRNRDGSGADAWTAGDAVVSLGQTGSAFIDLYAVSGLKSTSEVGPAIAFNVRNSATWNDWTARCAIGNLNGLFGYATDIYGAAFGVPTAAWLKIDPTNGIRIGHNATTKVQIDASGNASFAGSISASSGNVGGWTIGANTLSDSGGDIVLNSNIPSITVGDVVHDATGLTAGDLKIASSGITLVANGIDDANGYTFRVGATNKGGLYADNADGIYIHNHTTFIVIKNSSVDCSAWVNSVNGFSTRTADPGSGYFDADNGFKVNGNKVMGARGAAIANADGTLADITTKFNALLARFRVTGGHGSIAD